MPCGNQFDLKLTCHWWIIFSWSQFSILTAMFSSAKHWLKRCKIILQILEPNVLKNRHNKIILSFILWSFEKRKHFSLGESSFIQLAWRECFPLMQMGKVRKRINNFPKVTEAALVFDRMGIIHHSCLYFHVRVHLNTSLEYRIVV